MYRLKVLLEDSGPRPMSCTDDNKARPFRPLSGFCLLSHAPVTNIALMV